MSDFMPISKRIKQNGSPEDLVCIEGTDVIAGFSEKFAAELLKTNDLPGIFPPSRAFCIESEAF